jgi:multiple sugar transport system permease protein
MAIEVQNSNAELIRIRARRRRERRRIYLGLAFISPWLIGFFAFTLYPFIATLYYSFTKFDIVGAPQWIGLQNFVNLIHDPLFWTSLWNTAFYTVLEVPLANVVALGLALLLSKQIRGIGIYRTIFYLPTVVPVVAGSMLWLWLFNPSFGIVNELLGSIGIQGPGWMFSAVWAKPTFVLLGVWGVGAPMVIYLAALQGVPTEMYEVADLEGARFWRKLRHVTLPMISPTILFNLILGVVAALQYFTQAYIMTQGGPGNSTLFFGLYLYRQAFAYLHFGYASAMAWMLFVVVVVGTALLFRSSAKWVYYAGSK